MFESVTQNLSLAAFHDDQFLLGGGPGKDDFCVVTQNIIHLLLRKVLQICTVDYTGLGIPTQHRSTEYIPHSEARSGPSKRTA